MNRVSYTTHKKEKETVHRTGVKILAARIGIEANSKELLPYFPLMVEVKSLLTDFRTVEQIPFSSGLDGYISIEESSNTPSLAFSEDRVRFQGPLARLTKEASDLRFSLWGNQGLLYRFTLYLLEKKHRIYNLHACALYHQDKNHLYVITGGAGSGKTVFLLSGLEKRLKLFSTETVHFRMDKDSITWFMGSLVDNIRLGTLIHHFPRFLRNIDTQETDDEWQHKIALDFSSYKTDFEMLKMPSAVTILFPRIEESREGFHLTPMMDKKKAAKAIFDNITQKLSETVLLYDKIPVLGFDEKDLAAARHLTASQIIQHESVIQTASVLSNPYECWGELLD
ncbi:MAG: hypothetical protein OEY25_02355 [Candidatus Aminicenantes bacterium]|nr:hypothetical protein [Candidatus Aminicenantes bacterium]MDH5705020.1 hypothetical protein [Candidatus Aminicenantes bacterium]